MNTSRAWRRGAQYSSFDLENLTDFAIAYFERLLEKYGKGKKDGDHLNWADTGTTVVANNAKLYVNYKDGFVGMGMKRTTLYVIAPILMMWLPSRDGKFKVVRIADKVFVVRTLFM